MFPFQAFPSLTGFLVLLGFATALTLTLRLLWKRFYDREGTIQ